ncbi:agmatinase [Streptomyces sp. NPDC005820]|uniref:agmatinase n=1 Tax=Streptomyces sp. NPDC005820 TaxID=3157069 RepID=UPI0033FE3C42
MNDAANVRSHEGASASHPQPIDSSLVPRFAQPATFFRSPWVQDLDAVELDVALVGVPYDWGTNRNGARGAPAQIREMSRLIRRFNSDGVGPFDLVRVSDVGDAPVNPLDHAGAFDDLVEYYRGLRDRGIVPVSTGGDHGLAHPILRGLFTGEKIAMIHIDAHPDTYDELYGNRYNHGTMLRRGVEEDILDPTKLISIGIRGTRFSLDDRDYHAATGMRMVTMDEFEEIGRQGVVEEIRRVVGDAPVYVSFDLDALDPVYCPATGAPEPCGLSMRDAQVIIRSLAPLNLIGADVSELIPALDPYGHTALNAANLMFEMLCSIAQSVARRKGGEQ